MKKSCVKKSWTDDQALEAYDLATGDHAKSSEFDDDDRKNIAREMREVAEAETVKEALEVIKWWLNGEEKTLEIVRKVRKAWWEHLRGPSSGYDETEMREKGEAVALQIVGAKIVAVKMQPKFPNDYSSVTLELDNGLTLEVCHEPGAGCPECDPEGVGWGVTAELTRQPANSGRAAGSPEAASRAAKAPQAERRESAMIDGRGQRLAQLRTYAKVMVPIPRSLQYGETIEDAQIRTLLASLGDEARDEIADYVNDGKGQCPWPTSDSPNPRGEP